MVGLVKLLLNAHQSSHKGSKDGYLRRVGVVRHESGQDHDFTCREDARRLLVGEILELQLLYRLLLRRDLLHLAAQIAQ